MNPLKPEEINWRRGSRPFEMTMVKYQIKNLLKLARGKSALDLGCNDGFITNELTRRFERVVGVDASAEHVNIARQRVPGACFHVALFEEFNTRGELFDTIYMINILEHVDDPVKILSKAREWLNQDGCVIIHVPNAVSLNRRLGKLMGLIKDCYELSPSDIEVGHRRFYDADSLARDVIASGLKVDSMGSIMLKPFSEPQMQSFLDLEAWDKGVSGWGGKDDKIDFREKLTDALCEISRELPQYSTPIWALCTKD